jgi:nicotinamide-nucleotide amidase
VSEAETLAAVLPDEVDQQARAMLERACAADVSIATAESCTGGMVASLLTDVPGASHAFERGFVTYTDEAKAEMLGIPLDLIKREGAVSKPVAIAMAEGAIANSTADLAFSVTGFAGHGDEPGLVHFGCARKGRGTMHREERFGDIGRGPIRVECMRVAIEMMSEML